MITDVTIFSVIYAVLIAVSCSMVLPAEIQETREARQAGVVDASSQADDKLILILSRNKHSAARRSLKQTSVRSDILREMCERLREGGHPGFKTFCSTSDSVGPFFT
ncbi:hypothetical protein BsWGS_20695 [Bradybaena similaris]